MKYQKEREELNTETGKLAIRFENDAFDTSRKELMGRQVAGNSFLRAILADMGPSENQLYGYTNRRSSYEAFVQAINLSNKNIKPGWVRPDQNELLSEIGTLHFPDPNLIDASNLRLRNRPDAYSLTGVTHTTASHGAMELIRGLATAPVMPWDALICTSQSVKNTVSTILDAERDYACWRYGSQQPLWRCELPIIPLGLHTQDFKQDEHKRKAARLNLGIAEDEIVFMFIGRLNPFVKANPAAMYLALQAVYQQTGKKVTLIECGWFHAEQVQKIQFEARKELAPDIKYLHIDGRVEDAKWSCWAACDIFISLSDNIQETFGLTPVEAMAANKPVIVSDWDGYRELIIDGEQGFRISTSMSDETDLYAHAYETGADYGRYCAGVSQSTQVNIAELTNRIITLVNDPELRQTMGRNGVKRAKSKYDWSVVYKAYLELWSELESIRNHARSNEIYSSIFQNTPTAIPSRLSPSTTFRAYPTKLLTTDTIVRPTRNSTLSDYERFASLSLMQATLFALPTTEKVKPLFNSGSCTIGELAIACNETTEWTKRVIGALLKWGLFEID